MFLGTNLSPSHFQITTDEIKLNHLQSQFTDEFHVSFDGKTVTETVIALLEGQQNSKAQKLKHVFQITDKKYFYMPTHIILIYRWFWLSVKSYCNVSQRLRFPS